jgi:excisionase family DNA binding protein
MGKIPLDCVDGTLFREALSGLPAEDQYLTIKDICSELRLSHETVRQWILSGRLPGMKIGRQYRVRRVDLERMLAAGVPSLGDGGVSPNAMGPGARLDAGFGE